MNSIPKGYKKTEVGVIPDDWEATRLGQLFDFLYGKKLPSHIVGHKIYPVYGTNGPFKTIDSYLFNGESIIVGRKGAIRAIHYAPSNAWVIDTAFYSIQKQTICMKAIYYRMSLIDLSQMDSGSAIPSTNKQELENIRIALPPLPEQKAIAEVLSDMDALIEAQKELIAKKRDIKQGTMQELLSGRVRLPGYETKGWKHTDIGDIPDDWEVKELGNISDLYQPKTISQNEMHDSGPYLVYGANGIIGRYHRYNHKESEIIITCRGNTCGTINLSSPYAWITGNAMVVSIRNKESIDAKFILYFLKYTSQILEAITGGAQPEITREPLKKLWIYCPGFFEQKAIAEVLSDMDDEIENLEAELEKLNYMKRGMMQELLTGRIRLV